MICESKRRDNEISNERKTEKPLFNYMVRLNESLDYYLFEKFDEAPTKTQVLSAKNKIILLYEIYFNTKTRELHG